MKAQKRKDMSITDLLYSCNIAEKDEIIAELHKIISQQGKTISQQAAIIVQKDKEAVKQDKLFVKKEADYMKYRLKCKDYSKKCSRLVESNKEKESSRAQTRSKNYTQRNRIKYLTRLERGESKPAGHQYSSILIILSVLIRVQTGTSFRNISTILGILQCFFDLPDKSVPCANTIQNWTEKVGYNMLEKGDTTFLGTSVAAIIDESLQIGNNKMLLILFTPSEKSGEKSLNFSDVRVGYIGYSKSWKSEQIAAVLKETVEKFGLELSHVVGDECRSIIRSASLAGVEHLPDISHAIGSCIRDSYLKEQAYVDFVKLVGVYQCKGVNQSLSYLIPPSQRTKARFMNQHAMVDWAVTMIAEFDSLDDTTQAFFKELLGCEDMVKSLSNSLEIAQKVSLWLKEEGFSKEIYDKIVIYLVNIRTVNDCEQKFVMCLRSYIERYNQSFTKICLKEQIQEQTIDTEIEIVESITPNKRINVCSDVIESLFGKHKCAVSNNKFTGVSSVALELPLHTCSPNQLKNEIIPAIERIKLSKIKQWKGNFNIENQAIKRRDFFKKKQKKSNL